LQNIFCLYMYIYIFYFLFADLVGFYTHWTYICTFFVTFFSATIDGKHLIVGHKLHIGTPYRGKRFWTRVTNLHYLFIYYILDNLIWLYFPLTPIEKSNRPIVYHVVRLLMRFKQGELKVSRHMYFEWSTRFVFK
jgi:hypothetical protein